MAVTRRVGRGVGLALALVLPLGAPVVVASAGSAHRAGAADHAVARVQPPTVARDVLARTNLGSAMPRESVAGAFALMLVLTGVVLARRRVGVRHTRSSRAPPGLRSV